MTTRNQLRVTLFSIAAGLILVTPATVLVQQSSLDWRGPAGGEWPVYGGDWANTRYSTLAQINASNVKELAGTWTVKLPAGVSSRANPIVKDGMMYITAGRRVMALDPTTGATIWTWESKRGQPDSRGLSIGEDLVLVPAGPEVVALRQKTGEEVWSYRPEFAQTARIPTYANGIVVVPITDGDQYKRGRVVGLDVRSGKELWRFDIIPEPGQLGSETWPKDSNVWKYGGGAVWMPPSIDPELNLAFVGTGNAVPQWDGQTRPGDNLFTMSVVAMDLKTGKHRWHFQLLRHDIWEFDQSTPLILYDAAVNGRPRKALAVMRTDGFLFLLDRQTGKPIFPVEMRPQKQDPSLATARTQPFPKGADRFGPECVDRTLIPEGFRPGCYLDLWQHTDHNLTTPLLTVRLAPMAFSPRTSRFYVTGCVSPAWVRRIDLPFEDDIFFVNPAKIPGTRPYGLIGAIDSKTNKIAWQRRMPYPACAGSGVTATAGDLLFHAHGNGELQAFDARSGQLVWQFQTGSARGVVVGGLGPGYSPVVVYEVNGEQYVAAVMGDSVWVFKRHGSIGPQPAVVPPELVMSFEGVIRDTNRIAATATFRHSTEVAGPREVPYEYGVDPVRARVKAATPVTWTNAGKETHTFAARNGSWQTRPIKPGESASLTIDNAGTYEYICRDHPWTIGQLMVQ